MSAATVCDGPKCTEMLASTKAPPDWLALVTPEGVYDFHSRSCIEDWLAPAMEPSEGDLRRVVLEGHVTGVNTELGLLLFEGSAVGVDGEGHTPWQYRLHWSTVLHPRDSVQIEEAS